MVIEGKDKVPAVQSIINKQTLVTRSVNYKLLSLYNIIRESSLL